MNPIERLAAQFKLFPGIGPRQAKRFVYFLLAQNPRMREELAEHITSLKSEVALCKYCYRFFPQKGKNDVCVLCMDEARETNQLMLVEKDVDFENIEKSGAYKGRYFILGGSIPILETAPEKRIRSNELKEKVTREKELKEIILALSNTPEGNNTEQFLLKLLAPYKEGGLTISILGRGLSTGSELEYSDNETIKSALETRR